MVQSRLFRGVSDPLDARIPREEDNGGWKNPTSEIDDVEWEVFVGLVEFAYTGDYAVSLPKTRTKLNVANDEDVDGLGDGKSFVQTEQAQTPLSFDKKPPIHRDWDSLGFGGSKKVKKGTVHKQVVYRDQSMGRLLWEQFNECFDTLPPPSEAASFTVEEERILATLLYHAKLCVLADRYLIPKLRKKCLANLYKTLVDIDLDTLNVDNVLDLVNFVYPGDGMQGVPELKEMASRYVAANIGTFRQHERFKLMMQEIAQLGADLVCVLSGVGDWT